MLLLSNFIEARAMAMRFPVIYIPVRGAPLRRRQIAAVSPVISGTLLLSFERADPVERGAQPDDLADDDDRGGLNTGRGSCDLA